MPRTQVESIHPFSIVSLSFICYHRFLDERTYSPRSMKDRGHGHPGNDCDSAKYCISKWLKLVGTACLLQHLIDLRWAYRNTGSITSSTLPFSLLKKQNVSVSCGRHNCRQWNANVAQIVDKEASVPNGLNVAEEIQNERLLLSYMYYTCCPRPDLWHSGWRLV